jgi:hypothetical protein
MTYPSRYSNGKTVSAAQYITELICEHKAKINKTDLHYRFWTNAKWSRYYRDQIASANKLLLKYSAKAIIKALNDYDSQKIYSLRAPHLIPIIERYESEILVEEKTTTIVVDRSDNKSYRKFESNNSKLLNKIKEIEDGDNI